MSPGLLQRVLEEVCHRERYKPSKDLQSSSPEEPGDVLLPSFGHLLPPLSLLLLHLIFLFICLCYLALLQEPGGEKRSLKTKCN